MDPHTNARTEPMAANDGTLPNVPDTRPWSHANPPPESEETRDPSALNTRRSIEAIRTRVRAHRVAATPPVDWCSRALQPMEVRQLNERAEDFLQPGRIVEGAGEAVPALGYYETTGRRDTMIDTLERPTTISVRASEHRLKLVENLGVMQSAVDTALTAQARNSIEKMLAHQLAATHTAAMNLLTFMPGMGASPSGSPPNPPAAEIARLGNAAARLMEAFSAGCQALQRLKTGGTQRVLVQHQQVVLAKDGNAVLVNASDRKRRGGVSRSTTGRAKNGK